MTGTKTVPWLLTQAVMLFGFAGLGFAGYRASRNGRQPRSESDHLP
jgi:hypothetical protein